MFKLRNLALLVGLLLVGMFVMPTESRADHCVNGSCVTSRYGQDHFARARKMIGYRVVHPFQAVREVKPLRKAGKAAKGVAGRATNAAVKPVRRALGRLFCGC